MFEREAITSIKQLAQYFPVVSISGPRQSGKSTLVKTAFPNHEYVNLEDSNTYKQANDDPKGFIENFDNKVIIDEAQLCPELFSAIMLKVDETESVGSFILTGSQNYLLLKQISQSLAGRVGLITLLPLAYKEMYKKNNAYTIENIILQGGYPRLHKRKIPTNIFYDNLINTYIERDIKGYHAVRDTGSFRKLIILLANQTGQILNYKNLCNDLNITYKTIREWINLLVASYIIYLAPPYSINIRKQIIKSPKVYFYDTGLVCNLLQIRDKKTLINHPKFGLIFENFVFSEKMKNSFNLNKPQQLSFYRDKQKQEIDMINETNHSNIVVTEIKNGLTIQDKFLKILKKSDTLFNVDSIKKELIYRGDKNFMYKDVEIYGVKNYLLKAN